MFAYEVAVGPKLIKDAVTKQVFGKISWDFHNCCMVYQADSNFFRWEEAYGP